MAIIDTNSNVAAHCGLLKQKGVTHIGRYYSSSHWKSLTRSEAVAVCNAGLRLFVVFENDGDPTLNQNTGVDHGKIALQQAQGVGQPAGSAIYFALEHLPDGYKKKDVDGVKNYIRGVRSVLNGKYKVGAYSDGVILDALLDSKFCEHAWLSASTGFEGSKDFYNSGRWSLAQHQVDLNWDGLSIDLNEGKPDFGSFAVGSPAHAEEFLTVNSLRNSDDSCIPELIAIGSDVGECDRVREQARQEMVKIYGKPTLHNACACTLSLFLQDAGIDIPVTFGAGDLAKRIERDRGWQRIPVGQQQAGDVAVCRDDDHTTLGADHIFFVVKRVDGDLMSIADNQDSHSPHPRYASGKGGKTPVEYFLRASGAGTGLMAIADIGVPSVEVVVQDEVTDQLVIRFDSAGNPVAAS